MKRISQLNSFAKNMRHISATQAEKVMWSKLRNRQLNYKFNRQYVFDNKYIVDFICSEKRLIIEIDGGQHCENTSDTERNDYLKNRGYTVLRFWNNDVLNNTDGCLIVIKNTLDNL